MFRACRADEKVATCWSTWDGTGGERRDRVGFILEFKTYYKGNDMADIDTITVRADEAWEWVNGE